MPPSVPRTAIASPFPIGESPFRVKGVLYQGTQSFFGTKVKGGRPALLGAIDDERLRAFIDQKFLPSSWYDVLPVYPLIQAEARACNLPLNVYLRARSEWQAEQDMGGVYKVLLKLANPAAVIERLPRVGAQLFNFVTSEPLDSAERMRSFALPGMPAILVPWYSNGFVIYAQHALRLAGARSVQVVMDKPDPQGQLHGVDVVRVKYTITWT
jgi:hypothetical protein